MKILITGAKGFIGQNLIEKIKELNIHTIFAYDRESAIEDLDKYTKECDFVFHLAGVSRPKADVEFFEGNFGFTSVLLNHLKKHKNSCPIMISSSIKAEHDNPYGMSKKAGEDLIYAYGKETGANVYVFRFENVFGKWAKPNYNSAVATFSYNIANNLPVVINDPTADMQLIYIDDVVSSLIALLDCTNKDQLMNIDPVYKVKLGYITELLYSFKESRNNLSVPKLDDDFQKKLYSNYLSYLPQNDFAYDLKMNIDSRGSFTEFLKTPERGQVSINISRPGIIKGNHWHHTKAEKFLVVSGNGLIRFRKINTKEIIEYKVSGEKLQVLDIPPGYTHSIENIGETDMVTVIWANEKFDKDKSDTIFEEV